jgi:hypothetical protein
MIKQIHHIQLLFLACMFAESATAQSQLQTSGTHARLSLIGPASQISDSLKSTSDLKTQAESPFRINVAPNGKARTVGYIDHDNLKKLTQSDSFKQLGTKTTKIQITGEASKILSLASDSLLSGACPSCEVRIDPIPQPPPPPPQWERRQPLILRNN